MEAYSRALLLYLHAARGSGRGVETFAFGTRLTRLTAELGTRDPEAALAAAAKRVVDWSGGTRIGASLKAYNDEWGRRALTRGAVVVILSDGCERGEPGLVGSEMARLARQAFAVVWVNPLKGHAEYEPLTRGMRAALRTSTGSCRGTTSRASSRSVGCSPESNGGSRMKEIVDEVERWRERGDRVAIATVVATRRSAPRPVGAKFAVSERGELCGSVSGGCVENDVAVQALEVIESGEPRLLSYGITDDMALGVGLPCGGEIDVFLERLD